MKKGKEERNGRTIVVGVRMDQQSKELLTWALVKIAHTGDQVIALHILPFSSPSSTFSPDGISLSSSIDKELQSMLAVYEGFCNLKQVDLKLKVCKGSSLRRVLVREANSFAASQLILGVAKNSHAIGPSPISVAKYCAKKLPGTCSVLAVNNGKAVFQRESRETKESDSDASLSLLCKTGDNPLLVENPLENNCPICDSSNQAEQKLVSTSSPCKSINKVVLEVKTGWPVLRRSVMTLEKPKASMVQWAMHLPNRYTASPAAHPDHNKLMIFKSNDAASLNGKKENKFPKELASLQEKHSSICQSFTYRELMAATSNFSTEKLIGKGGSSQVYKGCLSDGKQLAVKILKPSEDAVREFVSEIEIITTLSHKNIVSLIGFCYDNDHFILVYNYLSRGSLEENLHADKDSRSIVSWHERYNVAVGVAEALDYLHSGSSTQPVIHKDVKSSNILLSDTFEPQLSDFGLATWANASQSYITCSDVAGTFGYLAPEYFMDGRVNEKIDIYAFGVVLLELLSGRKPISSEGPEGEKSLIMWAKPILHGGKTKDLVDPCLSNEYDSNQLEWMILAASLCLKRAARSRPQISVILNLLQGDEGTVKWAKSKVSTSTSDELDDEEDDEVANPDVNLRSHLSLALLDVEDDSTSISSTEQTLISLDDYLQGRWSRSSSF